MSLHPCWIHVGTVVTSRVFGTVVTSAKCTFPLSPPRHLMLGGKGFVCMLLCKCLLPSFLSGDPRRFAVGAVVESAELRARAGREFKSFGVFPASRTVVIAVRWCQVFLQFTRRFRQKVRSFGGNALTRSVVRALGWKLPGLFLGPVWGQEAVLKVLGHLAEAARITF